jgi:two-component system, chemotaxis family, protein-glutamate methylesterase/glutaminase
MSITAALPAGFPAAVAVIPHRSDQFPDLLRPLLSHKTAMPIRAAYDGEPIQPGVIYLCPSGMHMTADVALRLVKAPKLNFVRPCADLMFYTAAHSYGSRTIGVVLSGTGTDGALGARMIVDAGGTVIAQSPASSAYPEMPGAAAMLGPAQLVLAPDAIAPALVRLVTEPASPRQRAVSPLQDEWPRERLAEMTTVLLADDHKIILDGLRLLLREESDLTVVGETADGRETVASAATLKPDVVVMDVSMPELDGIEATRRICSKNPQSKVLILSAQKDDESIRRAFEAGAVGFLSKQKAYDELVQAIRTIVSTGEYVSRDLR